MYGKVRCVSRSRIRLLILFSMFSYLLTFLGYALQRYKCFSSMGWVVTPLY